MHKRLRHGFTIVEVATVLFVIAILALITTMTYNNVQKQSRDTHKEQGARVIMSALERYYDTHGEYPGGGELNSNKSLNALTDLQTPLQYLPGLTRKDIANDTYNFYAYCDNQECNGASWLKYRRYQIVYVSRYSTLATPTTYYTHSSVQASGGSNCTVRTTYSDPSYILQWWSEAEGVWKFIHGKRGKAEVYISSTAPTPPQTCEFTQL